jgi:hypothetical protein
MRYANGDGYLLHHHAKQRYEVWPWELIDHIPDSDKVYLQQSQ